MATVQTQAEADELNKRKTFGPYLAANGHLMLASLKFPRDEYKYREHRPYHSGVSEPTTQAARLWLRELHGDEPAERRSPHDRYFHDLARLLAIEAEARALESEMRFATRRGMRGARRNATTENSDRWRTGDMATMLTGEGVEFAQLAARASGLRLELAGMRRSKGSVYAICKRVYKLRGTREFVSEQMDQMVEGALHAREWQRGEITWDSIVEHNASLPWAELQRAYIAGVEHDFVKLQRKERGATD